eukprot:tig00000144_g9053.t1
MFRAAWSLRPVARNGTRCFAAPAKAAPAAGGDAAKPAAAAAPAKAAEKKPAAPAKGAKAAAPAAGPSKVAAADFSKIPINIFKAGSDPQVKPDSEYPEWLFHLLDVRPTIKELNRIPVEERTEEQDHRLWRLSNRKKIKTDNETRAL